MLLAIVLALAWIAGLVLVVAMCRVAARGDDALRRQFRDRWAESHERPLVT